MVEKNTKEEKTDLLLSLLKNDLKSDELKPTLLKDVPLEINPQTIKNLKPEDIKLLVKDAKLYLKNKILNSDGYKKAQIKELPRTLKGLVQLAKKFDIDISKITVKDVQTKSTATKTEDLSKLMSKNIQKDNIDLSKAKESKEDKKIFQ